ncbi:tRNA (N6-threonylcarbamoyladenosine(37)-N6)-methyltransferase TrmO, partial [Mesorhizobium sp. M7A.F.Ca.CA.004.04.2.1]
MTETREMFEAREGEQRLENDPALMPPDGG